MAEPREPLSLSTTVKQRDAFRAKAKAAGITEHAWAIQVLDKAANA